MSHALKRLAVLYGMVEQMRSVEVRVAAAAVDEVNRAGAMHRAVSQSQSAGGREALASGNRVDWILSETSRSFADSRIMQLAQLRVERDEALDAAVLVQRQSRIDAEQMDRVVENARQMHAVQEGRRTQAAADDRYASRREWTRRKTLAAKRPIHLG